MEKTFLSLVHIRNLIAHEYQEFTAKDIFQALKEINVIKQFIVVVKKKISSGE